PKIAQQVRGAERIYAQRREKLLEELAARGIEAHGRSGLNMWIPVAGESATVQGLADAGWAVRAGESYRLRSGPGIRITIATLTVEEAPRLASDIAAALRPAAVAHVV
ncbi:MAG TPA: aminotransferase class I/II-fold pyridoxal phosphate-dependent enzyme, partial [Candidatus Binataceae bacterium]|nr:aminotransferase class I/II-fold pyridoxal phosphate-dependent enzyme [Candidatus Binataceae bacterium]